MSKRSRAAGSTAANTHLDWPLVVFVWIAGLGFTGYIIARIVLDSQPHPVHWASGLVGAVAGYFLGWLWYHWRGDII